MIKYLDINSLKGEKIYGFILGVIGGVTGSELWNLFWGMVMAFCAGFMGFIAQKIAHHLWTSITDKFKKK